MSDSDVIIEECEVIHPFVSKRDSFTMFDNPVLDEIFPACEMGEWCIITLVIRKTVGYVDEATGGRKIRDWITLSQFVEQTPIKSRTTAKKWADSCVEKGYLVRTVQNPEAPPRKQVHLYGPNPEYKMVIRRRIVPKTDTIEGNFGEADESIVPDSDTIEEPIVPKTDTIEGNFVSESGTTKESIKKESKENRESVTESVMEQPAIAGAGAPPSGKPKKRRRKLKSGDPFRIYTELKKITDNSLLPKEETCSHIKAILEAGYRPGDVLNCATWLAGRRDSDPWYEGRICKIDGPYIRKNMAEWERLGKPTRYRPPGDNGGSTVPPVPQAHLDELRRGAEARERRKQQMQQEEAA